jgi:hypothetical protein
MLQDIVETEARISPMVVSHHSKTYMMEGRSFVRVDAMLMQVDAFFHYASAESNKLVVSIAILEIMLDSRVHLQRRIFVSGVESSIRFSRVSGREEKANSESRNANAASIGTFLQTLEEIVGALLMLSIGR